MADTRKPRPGDKIKLHHPIIRREVIRTRKQAAVLAESGWREGSLPPKVQPAPVAPAKKTTAAATSEGK